MEEEGAKLTNLTNLTNYQKYKETILACRKRWLENPENKEKSKQWSRDAVKRNYYKKKEMLEKYKELERLIKN